MSKTRSKTTDNCSSLAAIWNTFLFLLIGFSTNSVLANVVAPSQSVTQSSGDVSSSSSSSPLGRVYPHSSNCGRSLQLGNGWFGDTSYHALACTSAYDQSWFEIINHDCKPLVGIWSRHSNVNEDRQFILWYSSRTQGGPSGFCDTEVNPSFERKPGNFQFTSLESNFNYAENDAYLTGWESYYDRRNGRNSNDRRFKFFFKKLKSGWTKTGCSWTAWTGYDAEWSMAQDPAGMTIYTGIKSRFSTFNNDRIFQFEFCTMTPPPPPLRRPRLREATVCRRCPLVWPRRK
jgi:hypothetical protein